MMNFVKQLIIAVAVLTAPVATLAVNPWQVRWHDITNDTTVITRLLIEARNAMPDAKAQSYVPMMARHFLGKPYVAATLECPDSVGEMLTVNLDELDCTTFVETVMALSLTAASGRTSWRDYLDTLESLRYRRGVLDGYPSRLHYVSDWIVDNTSRDNIEEVTESVPGAAYIDKSLSFISSHRDAYPALKDDENYRRIRSIEDGYRNHRYPYVKKSRIIADKKTLGALREGDIVAITTDMPGLDVSHFGIITIVDGAPRLLHASSAAAKVTVDSQPLSAYFKRSKHATGLRVLRLK